MNGENLTKDTMAIPDEALQVLPILRRCLGDSLVAVYLYGSAVRGDLRPQSDVDLLVVTDRALTPGARDHLVAELLLVSGRHPAKPDGPHPLELIIFLQADLVSAVYPARSEFLYGEWLREDFEAGVAPEPKQDPDFTLVLAQARREATSLAGPAAAELLPIIADTDIDRAIGDALPGLLGNLEGDERNVLLTLARMWRTLATGEFVPKEFAAGWAISRLPAGAADLLALARDASLGTQKDDDWPARQREVQRLAHDISERVTAVL